ncbi:UMP kinase [Phototrophicus methaneseepsis]|uniref:Uridylate kinase n=2 Tax=Phototrophicus methaneseepsis TaxID=2710758 RepID=A0A7S8EDR1_9CHLR|nr:UMP kinase [Phototrophicus methaneseepsis]
MDTNGAANKSQSPYGRVLLKLSGEALGGEGGCGIDPDKAAFIAGKVKDVYQLGVQVAVVMGGGNLWRGANGEKMGMDRTTADHIGMLGTVMNGLTLRDALERQDVPARVQTAIQMNQVAEPYIRLRAIRHMEKGRVVIFAGGTGNPFFTTDSAAALRATEIEADIVIKATQVDGVYNADPKKDPTATRYTQLTYKKVLEDRLNVMDMTAFTLCEENDIPILVVNFWQDDDLLRALQGDHSVGTIITK